jgi:hypothetical protein
MSEPLIPTPARRRVWLCLVLSATLISIVLVQAQEPELANADADTGTQNELVRVSVEVNRPPPQVSIKPLEDVVLLGQRLSEEGRFGPDTTLDLLATAELNEDGSFKPESLKIEWRTTANKEVTMLAQQFLTAVSQSGLLNGLRTNSARLTIRLDRENFALGVETDCASEADASQMATGYGTLILIARKTREGTPEGRLYEALKVTSDGKVFRVAFELPKMDAAKMIQEMLDKRAARSAAPSQD